MCLEVIDKFYKESEYEKKMATDYDFALMQVDIDADSTIEELRDAVNVLNGFGWETTERDLLDTV